MNTDIFLQGSYRNGTNVRADSDVYIVAHLNSSFGYDVSALPPERVFEQRIPQSRHISGRISEPMCYSLFERRTDEPQSPKEQIGAISGELTAVREILC
jgi:hypothetical protein